MKYKIPHPGPGWKKLPSPTLDELTIQLAENDTKIDHICFAIQNAITALGAPTMNYEPKIAIKEYDRKIKKATKILLQALKEERSNG